MSCCGQITTGAGVSASADTGKRVNYVKGMLLGVDDFVQEQAWGIARRHELAREALGYGTLSGLRVWVPAEGAPVVHVGPGMALTPSGTPVTVSAEQCCDINTWLKVPANAQAVRERLGEASGRLTLHVVLAYAALPTDKVPIPGEPCRSEAALTSDSRIADCFRLELRWAAPAQLEEDAIRAFGDFCQALAQLPSDASSPPLDDAALMQALRTAADAWLSSASPPAGDGVFGSPPLLPGPTDSVLRTALRLWVTELRPRWRARYGQGADAIAPGSTDDAVLLATLGLTVYPDLLETDANPAVNEGSRPFMLSLRAVQEVVLHSRAPEPSDALPMALDLPCAGSAGTDSSYARADHQHPAPALGGDVQAADATHVIVQGLQQVPVADTPPSDGDVLMYLSSVDPDEAAPASPPAGRWRPVALAVPGAATTAPSAIAWAAGADVGSSADYARADHVHAMVDFPEVPGSQPSDGTPAAVAVGGTGSPGTDARYARADHVHALVDLPDLAAAQPSDTAPTSPAFGTFAAAGIDGRFSRADHSHGLPSLPDLGGDVEGHVTDNTVARLQGVALKATQPAQGDMLTFSAGAWTAGRPMIEALTAGILRIDLATNAGSLDAAAHPTKVAVDGNSGKLAHATLVAGRLPTLDDVRKSFIVLLTPVADVEAPFVAQAIGTRVVGANELEFGIALIPLGTAALNKRACVVHYEVCRFVPAQA